MQYYVKHIYTATANHPNVAEGTVQEWYIGKGGKCDVDPRFIEGWSKEHFAERYLKNDKEWFAEHPNDAWDNEWSIVSVA